MVALGVAASVLLTVYAFTVTIYDPGVVPLLPPPPEVETPPPPHAVQMPNANTTQTVPSPDCNLRIRVPDGKSKNVTARAPNPPVQCNHANTEDEVLAVVVTVTVALAAPELVKSTV